MKLSDFHFDLPGELIAHYPTEQRVDSRLLTVNRQQAEIRHAHFRQFPELVRDNDLLVFNDTRVIAARLLGRKSSGGRIEVLLERILSDNRVLVQIRASKSPKRGGILEFPAGDDLLKARVLERQEDFFILEFECADDLLDTIDQIGHIPLPPYIRRDDEALDRERYQTVYGKRKGAVAAPTAGLHFDQAMLKALCERGIDMAFVTLHVGAGTFQPVRTEQIEAHRMHAEYLEVDISVCNKVRECRRRGGRVIAVGTTSVRCLETASAGGEIQPYRGDTNIFIYPGYRFRSVDALLTNFHLPESTLIMLVSAFAGHDLTMHAYREAVKEKYRFFSYGDAMFIT